MTLSFSIEEDLCTNIDAIKMHRHDLIHHLLATKRMLDSNCYEECKQYLAEILEDVSSFSEILPISSDAVAGLLLSYRNIAFKKNIYIHYSISDNLKEVPCKISELNTILGNLILNSIEAVEFQEDGKRHIHVSIGRSKSEYFFEVNNFTNALEFEKNITKIFKHGYSSKNNIDNQGQGLSIVQTIAEKYNGYIYPKLVDDTVTFTVIIPYRNIDTQINT